MLTLDGKAYKVFQSTPPARGATVPVETLTAGQKISIHAPREGGDPKRGRPPRRTKPFQSTPPARGATVLSRILATVTVISIHAPREGGDPRMQRL